MLNLFSIFLLKIFSIATILNLHDECVVAISMIRLKRFSGVKQWYYLWPESRIPYIIDSSSFEGPERRLMKQAMREWERSTCIKFMDRKDEIVHPDYVYFTKSDAECYTNGVGRRRGGKNYIYLGENCLTKRIILHELGHIIGLHHEHQRPDRNEYVNINMGNVKTDGTEQNFEKLSSEDVITLNQPYDLNSIMHYEINAFARDRSKNTITPLKTEDVEISQIGRRAQLSDIDIRGVRLLYNCSECGKLLENDTGTLETAIYVNTSTTTAKHCEWSIAASRGEHIVFEITSLSILESSDCTSDYLEIKDEFKMNYNSLGRYCEEENTSQTVGSSDSRILVTYRANNANEKYFGFKANYHKSCTGEIEIKHHYQEYFLESPGFPNEYPADKYCVWHLTAPYDSKLIMKFNYFELESSDNCENDYVEIRNGPSYYSPLIGKYCNNTSPGVIRSKGYALYVKFVSNGKVQRAGFSAIITLR